MKVYPYALVSLLACTLPAVATVTVTSPTFGMTVPSPVHYVASAILATTCSTGVASMGIYVNNSLIYVVNGAQVNTNITMKTGAEHTVVEEWDHCGGATYTTVNLTVGTSSGPTVNITANPPTIPAGSTSTLTVTAANSAQVTIAGSDGTTYHLPVSGGTQIVSPTATTTYTAEVSGAGGSASETSTVDVIPAQGVSAVTHVIFMLQENRTFDHYFGMLNPYRKVNGWNIGDDGKDYEVDGIDDNRLNTIKNQDDQGTSYPLFKLKSTCVDDESSSWLESYGDVNRWDFSTTRTIAMDGFVHIGEGYAKSCLGSGKCSGTYTDGRRTRSGQWATTTRTFLTTITYMASQFAGVPRSLVFARCPPRSLPNRVATFTGGTTQGLVLRPAATTTFLSLNIPTIFQELDGGNVTWKVYYTTTLDLCLASNPCSTTNPNGNDPDTTFSDL